MPSRAVLVPKLFLRTVLLLAVILIGVLNAQTPSGCGIGGRDIALASPGSEMSGWAENHSYTTTCAEEDNVNVPIFGPEVRRYWVVATHPTYDIGVDNCAPDFSGCSSSSSNSGSSSKDPPTAVRSTQGGSCTTLWDDGITVVLSCTEPDWWRPFTMDIIVGTQVASGHRLVLHRKIQGENSWPQFFVLYEDGNMRLKPHPPEGRPDVCFGSSVIIGPAAPATRPFIDIQEVRVYPSTLSLDITYRNGEIAHVTLSVDRTQAVAEVEVGYTTSVETPFATFRSMWVEDGNADVDHIQALAGDFPILGSWTTLEGPWWFFHRMVRSQHNTSAPDIRIGIDTAAVFRVDRRGNVFTDRGFFCGLPGTTNPPGPPCFNVGLAADIAERIDVSEPVEPGDVVEIDPTYPKQYRKSRGSYSTLVAGVIVAASGFVLANLPQELKLLSLRNNTPPPTPLISLLLPSFRIKVIPRRSVAFLIEAQSRLEMRISLRRLLRWRRSSPPGRPLLALMGRVKVKATTENGPIQPGDLLVSASIPGYAMRCPEPQECEGAVLGKALEPLEQGTGVILMLLTR